MMPKKLIYCMVWLAVILLTTNLWAFEKVGSTSFQFLKVMTDARSTGLGEAYSAVTNNSDAVFWNPAALTRVNRFDATLSYLDYFLDVRHSAVSAAYNLGTWGVVGFQAIATDVGEIEVTRVEDLYFIGDQYNPGLTGETIRPGATVVGLSYGRYITDKFSFGITVKYVREDLAVKSANAVMFDGGLIYKTGFRSLQVSTVIRHFGADVKFFEKSYPLPQTFNIGIAGYLIAPNNAFLKSSEVSSLMLAFDLVQPRDYDQQYNVGLEYGFQNMLFLRGGYKMNYDEESYSMGLGLQYRGYRFDYSYSEFGQFLDSLHRFTLGINLD